jgi:light-regulated signal transduction histidine kinase (bacteriophytochrome)
MNKSQTISTQPYFFPLSRSSDMIEMVDTESLYSLLKTDELLTDQSMLNALYELYIHMPTELLRSILARPNFFPDKSPFLLQFRTHQEWVKQLTETILLNTKRIESFKKLASSESETLKNGCTWRSSASQQGYIQLIAEQMAFNFGRTQDVGTFLTADILPVNPHDLKILVQELMRNALQHSKSGEEIRIETYNLGAFSLLSVYDSGDGMKEEHVERLKNPLIHVSQLIYGLGYVLIKRVVQQYKGGLEVVSVPNKETQVYVTFPVHH